MGTKYSSQSISGYNTSPPSDDGTASEANKVKWSTIKSKITDPVKTLTEAIDSALVTHVDRGPTAITTATTLDATHYQKVVEASGTSEITLTDAATLTAGWFVDIINTGSGNMPILRATASDTIDEVSADITLYPLDSIRIMVNAGADGFMTEKRGVKFNKGADVASATALPVVNDGNYFDVTGTTTVTSINSIGTGSVIKLHFDGILTLTHHATNLILPGGANITTAAGDEAEFVEHGAGTWRCTNYTKADGTSVLRPAGSVVQVVNVQDGAVATGTTALPWDDTIPQITEGDQFMSLAITPTSATNKLKIEVTVHLANTVTNASPVAALFQDATANALAATARTDGHASYIGVQSFVHYMTSGTTSSTTFRVRCGAASGTTTFNGQAGSRFLGGVLASSITITEIQV